MNFVYCLIHGLFKDEMPLTFDAAKLIIIQANSHVPQNKFPKAIFLSHLNKARISVHNHDIFLQTIKNLTDESDHSNILLTLQIFLRYASIESSKAFMNVQ